jgi:hypothetical protein
LAAARQDDRPPLAGVAAALGAALAGASSAARACDAATREAARQSAAAPRRLPGCGASPPPEPPEPPEGPPGPPEPPPSAAQGARGARGGACGLAAPRCAGVTAPTPQRAQPGLLRMAPPQPHALRRLRCVWQRHRTGRRAKRRASRPS